MASLREIRKDKSVGSLHPVFFTLWKLCESGIPTLLQSEEFKKCWSEVQATSSFVIIPGSLSEQGWNTLMDILHGADVSRLEHLVLAVPVTCESGGMQKLADLFATGRFRALQTLVLRDGTLRVAGSSALAKGLKMTNLPELRSLGLPNCEAHLLMKAISDGSICQLVEFGVSAVPSSSAAKAATPDPLQLRQSALKNIINRGLFSSLRHLELINGALGGNEGFEILVQAGNNGRMPGLRSLRLSDNDLVDSNLSSLVVGSWFYGVENLMVDGCSILDSSLSNLIKSIVNRGTNLRLQCLDLSRNGAIRSTNLADVEFLPHLRELDLSLKAHRAYWSFEDMINGLRRGILPSLQTLNLTNHYVDNDGARAIVQAYLRNEELIAKIQIDWALVGDRSLRPKAIALRERNERLRERNEELRQFNKEFKETFKEAVTQESQKEDKVKQAENVKGPREDHKDLDMIPASSAKMFLCGYEKVGKTTLRKSLQKSGAIKTKLTWERRPTYVKKSRTRGIELAQIAMKNTSDSLKLLVWDLAGQEEFHVMHGTFLPDMGLAGGKATIFVLVFRAAPFRWEAETELHYWLRFVASSSMKDVKRHVLIVLNCFHGERGSDTDLKRWQALIAKSVTIFQDFLHIHRRPFLSDVRLASSVKEFKAHLFGQAGKLLEQVRMPQVCLALEQKLMEWSKAGNNQQFPILSWEALEKFLGSEPGRGRQLSGNGLKAAASYLHEFGQIIYFGEENKSAGSESRSVLVPNPEWFCSQVVGQLLLPKEMLEAGKTSISMKVNGDGSISMVLFQAFFEHLLAEGTRVEDVISMLRRLGLCYTMENDKIFIPALIRDDDLSFGDWSESGGVHWVMGRSLTPHDPQRTRFPVTVFRRLQVELAQDANFGGRGDSCYRAGKSFSSFRLGGLLVLVHFDVHYSNPKYNRVDILVKSLVVGEDGEDRDLMTMEQLDCIGQIMQKLERLCAHCCPGVEYIMQVIRPQSAAERTWAMSERQLMPVAEIKSRIQEYGIGNNTTWTVRGEPVKEETLLSLQELEEVSATVGQLYAAQKQDAAVLGLLAVDAAGEVEEPESSEATEEEASHEPGDSAIIKAIREEGKKVRDIVREEAKLTRHHFQVMKKELKFTLSDLIQKQKQLVTNVQSLQSFSIEEKECSVPRYMFLSTINSEDKSSVWVTLKNAFLVSIQLHLLCEASYESGNLHEVKGQEGIEIKKSRDWLVKIAPWLRWSLQVAIIVAKVGGGAILPGLGLLIPDLPATGGVILANAVDGVAPLLLKDWVNNPESQQRLGNHGSSEKPINLKERNIAEAVLGDLMRELGHAVFVEKMALRRVVFKSAPRTPAHGSRQTQPSVAWICNACYEKYGNKNVTDITPRK